jgi:hypothetical protein
VKDRQKERGSSDPHRARADLKVRGPFGALILVCVLAACGQQQEAQTPPVVEAPSANTAIGPDGAAGIGAALAMNVEAVRAAAANYIVAQVEDQVEGQPFTAITLSAGDEEVFRVLPTADGAHIHAIVTRSSQARGPTQDIVGRTLFGVAPPEQVPFCATELVQGAPGFACSTDAAGSFWRVYKLPEGADEASSSFDDIDPDLLHDSVLTEMRWIAPRAQ